MIFAEQKTETGYIYDVEDVFGRIHLESDTKLPGDTLDDVVVFLLGSKSQAARIEGSATHGDSTIAYTFDRTALWSEDDEDTETCTSTPTSTQEPESEPTATNRSKRKATSWYRRFVVAFREAWKKASDPSSG